MSNTIKEYDTCTITPQLVKDTFDICIENDGLKAGICCRYYNQIKEISEFVREAAESYPPWYIEQVVTNNNREAVVRFTNGSSINVFKAGESSRGKRFHYLRVDETVDGELQNNVLIRTICSFNYQDPVFKSELADLLTFAQHKLQSQLHPWQKDMLTVLLKGGIYIAGRNIGKQAINSIYEEWKNNKLALHCCPCEYTYDEIMAGIKEE